MARPLRFAPAGWPLHVWCRGNRQQDIFFHDADRRRYLDLLGRHAEENAVHILGYCLMRNHVHLVLQPSSDDGLSWSMMRLNSEYAQGTHFRMQVTGHFWQGRFKASVMDDSYLWTVMRYVELNPVRAGIVAVAQQWPWSSAGAHVGDGSWPDWLAREPFCSRYTPEEWQSLLGGAVSHSVRGQIWRALRQNRALASTECVAKWEAESKLQLQPRKPGRPRAQSKYDPNSIKLFSHGA